MDAGRCRVPEREGKVNRLTAFLEFCASIMEESPRTTVYELNQLIPTFAPYGVTRIRRTYRGCSRWVLMSGRDVVDWATAQTDAAALLLLAKRWP